ncbi:alpha/beta fold hydrolase [uncultured Sphingomonas sp.]|uniref:alpha/beta hydrolase family protein n=1 Tax=uncultured Sphingomonas sp. TaxID=158754 RepID=UPI0025CC0BA2|nr:alpha/beta fold hydrolase [uncultured Sphingomonas sp.]
MNRRVELLGAVALLMVAQSAEAIGDVHADAVAFGAREGVEQLSLSPDGSKIAFIAPAKGQGATLFTMPAAEGSVPKPALVVPGTPDRLRDCRWVSETRLVCTIWGMVKTPDATRPLSYSRVLAVDESGGNVRMLTNKQTNQRRNSFYGGGVIDWLPGTDGQVLMVRAYARTEQTGTNIGSRRDGLAVDRIDTRTGAKAVVEQPRPNAVEYQTDGRGNVRLIGYYDVRGQTNQWSGNIVYRYRPIGKDWTALSTFNTVTNEGFNPYAVDPEKNVAFGLRKLNGRLALYTHALDGSERETLVSSRPDVDIDGLVRVGRDRRVVGYTYVTEKRVAEYLDPQVNAMVASLRKALPKLPQVDIVDASTDGNKLLVHASADTDPGRYFLFDKAAKRLQVLMLTRPELEGRKLAAVQPVRIKIGDGSTIPGYLTLPPDGPRKGLPAIVMPHGGPSARDEWGFDWLAQFYAARGYAVLQPNYRGSAGYGDDYLMQNGFRAWKTAVGDVNDAGRWLVSEGIADQDKLAVFGWSYGGYAALESVVLDPKLFRAIVAVAPVTELSTVVTDRESFSDSRVQAGYIGQQPATASPAANAASFAAPVLLAHGTLDANVNYAQSMLMLARLRAAGKPAELMTFEGLDHYLEDADARTQLLEQSDGFLRKAMKM